MKVHRKYQPPALADSFHVTEAGTEVVVTRTRHRVLIRVNERQFECSVATFASRLMEALKDHEV